MDEIIKKYEKEIEANLAYMEQLGPETEEYAKIEKVTLEMTKFVADEKNREKESKGSNLDKYVDYGFKAAGILIPASLFLLSIGVGYKLEEEGSITSKTLSKCLGFVKLF